MSVVRGQACMEEICSRWNRLIQYFVVGVYFLVRNFLFGVWKTRCALGGAGTRTLKSRVGNVIGDLEENLLERWIWLEDRDSICDN